MKEPKPEAKRPRKIVQTAGDRQANHRADFRSCPHCGHDMKSAAWDEACAVLVLQPGCYKSGCVSVMSECPKCFELSWVHTPMGGFQWNDAWPEKWKAAVQKREAFVRLEALREWGAGLCHGCRHLTHGEVKYHAWRHCVIGSGPPRAECDRYEARKKPKH